MLPEAEQLFCVRDVGSARALVPDAIDRGCTYIAGTDVNAGLTITVST